MMFYNKQVFDAADLEYPSPGWDLDDFVTLAVALTDDEGANKRYGYLPFPDDSDRLFFLEQYGAQLVDLSTRPATYHFDALATIEAVRWYVALSAEHGVMPEPSFGLRDAETFYAQSQSWISAIENGRAAMWPDFLPYALTLFPGEWTKTLGMAPMPWGPGRVASFTQQVFAISAHTEHPQACWEWLKFLTEQSALFVDAPDGLPARRSVAGSVAYRQQVGEETATLYQQAIEQSEHLSSARLAVSRLDIGYPFRWFYDAVQFVVEGQDAEVVLGEAQRKAEAYTVCLQTRQGLQGEELVTACVLEVDPDSPFFRDE
jgi:ABC-type glycerol-3-phosphate transport system substrate-binding protein